MIVEIMLFAIPLMLSLVCYAFEKKKKIGIFFGILSMIIGFVCIYNKNADNNELEYEDFSLPFLNFKINFGMTREEIYEKAKEEEFVFSGDTGFSVDLKWEDISGIVGFAFDENQKLCQINFSPNVDIPNIIRNNKDIENAKKEVEIHWRCIQFETLHSLEKMYGGKKELPELNGYYWKNAKHFTVFYKEFQFSNIETVTIVWYEPDCFYKEIIPKMKIDIGAEKQLQNRSV